MQRSSAHAAVCFNIVNDAWNLNAYGPVAYGKSIRNYPLVMLWSDRYERSVGVHMDARTCKCTLRVPLGIGAHTDPRG